MVATILNLFKKQVKTGPERITAVLAGFNDMIKELAAARSVCDSQSLSNSEKIRDLQDANAALVEASEQAAEVANNLSKLIGE